MPYPIKTYYYTFYEMSETQPFLKMGMKSLLAYFLDVFTTPPDFSSYQVPSDLTTNESIYNELLSLLYGRYYKEYVIKIEKALWEGNPVSEDIEGKYKEWGYMFVSKLNMTYEFYMPLVKFYRSAQANLMDDITATSTNKVAFNDTPQNANTSGVYEGDDYITHFTKTENESKSPLSSKIMRLKEIQDHYKNVMADWVKEFESLFMENV